MKLRLLIALAAIAATAVAGWFLHGWVSQHALAIRDAGEWALVPQSSGWALFWALWPVAAVFAVIALGIGGFLGLGLTFGATRAEIHALQSRTEQAEQAQATAEQHAREQAEARVDDEQNRLYRLQTRAKLALQETDKKVQAAEQAVAQAQREAAQAKAEKTKAMKYNDRKKTKTDRLRAKIEANETVTLQDVQAVLR